VRRLRDGDGVTSNRCADPTIPTGIQEVQEDAAVSDDWEMVAVVEDFAMAAVTAGVEGLEPTFEEARKRPDWSKWEEAIKAELVALERIGTWSLTERPPGANVVGSKWVLRIKKNAAGEIEKYKARLVAKGFTQIYGVDFYETYAPIAKLSSFRLLLAIAARNNWPIHTAFLNGVLAEDESIYLEQLPGYATKDQKYFVLKLHKSIYGLRQGAKNWYDFLCEALADLHFKRSESDHGVFFKEEENHLLVLAIHVDDCMILGSSLTQIQKFKVEMNAKYKLTDLGPINWLLGIKITRDYHCVPLPAKLSLPSS
jgi:hypothetical protein